MSYSRWDRARVAPVLGLAFCLLAGACGGSSTHAGASTTAKAPTTGPATTGAAGTSTTSTRGSTTTGSAGGSGGTAPKAVVILIAGFTSSLPASTYDPLSGAGSPALTAITTAFDPNPASEPAGCSSTPDLTASLSARGAVLLPFSYSGTQLTGTATAPTVTVAAYPSSAPSTVLPQSVAPLLATEVNQAHALWPSAPVVVVGHSEGGYVAEQYFVNDFEASGQPEVRGIFSLDSPINGVSDVSGVGVILRAVKVPASTALLSQFASSWTNAASNDSAILAKEHGGSTYVAVGTAADNVYRIADSPNPGIASQVLVDPSHQPLASAGAVNLLDPASPPPAGLTDPAGVVASHQCVMGNSTVIAAITARLAGTAG